MRNSSGLSPQMPLPLRWWRGPARKNQNPDGPHRPSDLRMRCKAVGNYGGHLYQPGGERDAGTAGQRLGGKPAVSGMTIGTFHAICLRQLEDVRLIGEAEALALAAQVLARLGESRTPRQFLQSVSRRKTAFPRGRRRRGRGARRLSGGPCRRGVLDFDDLLLRALEQGPRDSRPFSYLLVDEFQDCNDLQYELVRTWSREGKACLLSGTRTSRFTVSGAQAAGALNACIRIFPACSKSGCFVTTGPHRKSWTAPCRSFQKRRGRAAAAGAGPFGMRGAVFPCG